MRSPDKSFNSCNGLYVVLAIPTKVAAKVGKSVAWDRIEFYL
jgi:hypothetical protein